MPFQCVSAHVGQTVTGPGGILIQHIVVSHRLLPLLYRPEQNQFVAKISLFKSSVLGFTDQVLIT